eukprot:5187750-Pyramimonas_sp.AAC.1
MWRARDPPAIQTTFIDTNQKFGACGGLFLHSFRVPHQRLPLALNLSEHDDDEDEDADEEEEEEEEEGAIDKQGR